MLRTAHTDDVIGKRHAGPCCSSDTGSIELGDDGIGFWFSHLRWGEKASAEFAYLNDGRLVFRLVDRLGRAAG